MLALYAFVCLRGIELLSFYLQSRSTRIARILLILSKLTLLNLR